MYINRQSRIVKLPIDFIVETIAVVSTFKSPSLNSLNNLNSLNDLNSLRILSAEMKLEPSDASRAISANDVNTMNVSNRVNLSFTNISVGNAMNFIQISKKNIPVNTIFMISKVLVSSSLGRGYLSIARNTVLANTSSMINELNPGLAANLNSLGALLSSILANSWGSQTNVFHSTLQIPYFYTTASSTPYFSRIYHFFFLLTLASTMSEWIISRATFLGILASSA